jgi:hypothetical protein
MQPSAGPGVPAPAEGAPPPRPGAATGAEQARTALPQIVAAIGGGSGAGRISLQLDPPELGRIDIDIDLRESTLRATLAAERPATSDMIRRHADILLQHLEEAGFADVDLGFGGERGRREETSPAPGESGPASAAPGAQQAGRGWQAASGGAGGIDLRL